MTINISRALKGRIEMLETELHNTTDPADRAAIQRLIDGCKASQTRAVVTYCHYCGLPTRHGVCSECGTEPF